LRQFLPHLIGRHTNDGVLAGIEVLRELEKFHPDRALFQSAGRTPERVLDYVCKKFPAALTGTKRGALQKASEFRLNVLFT